MVQSKFNEDTAQFFRAFQQNTSGLNPSALQDLKLASSLAAHTESTDKRGNRPPSNAVTDQNWRDRRRGPGNFNRGGYNSNRGGYNYSSRGYQSPDVYNTYANRNVPPQRPAQSDSH